MLRGRLRHFRRSPKAQPGPRHRALPALAGSATMPRSGKSRDQGRREVKIPRGYRWGSSRCIVCQAPIDRHFGGRRKFYCGGSCRKRGTRLRRKGVRIEGGLPRHSQRVPVLMKDGKRHRFTLAWKECCVCGLRFQPHVSAQSFCSSRCRKRYSRLRALALDPGSALGDRLAFARFRSRRSSFSLPTPLP